MLLPYCFDYYSTELLGTIPALSPERLLMVAGGGLGLLSDQMSALCLSVGVAVTVSLSSEVFVGGLDQQSEHISAPSPLLRLLWNWCMWLSFPLCRARVILECCWLLLELLAQ